MIEFYVSGQTLKFFTPVIAADSLNYLTAKVNFTDAEWEGYSKWLHFRQDEELGADTYDIQLDENNEITADDHLNLTVGQWEIYLTGTKDESRLTTVPVILTVKESGLIDGPLHGLPMSVAEQVDFNAKQALLLAQAVKNMADEGKFDGEPGTSFAPLGYYPSLTELEANVLDPSPGDVYGLGEAMPYDMYSWDGVNLVWVNNGPIQGAAGEKGESGAVFIPAVDANGNISWTNDGGLENPVTRNIRGPAGAAGEKGESGPGAYEKAKEAGYTGTEATFYQALTAMPYHNARHLPDGADPILLETGNIKNAAITRAKLAPDALYSPWVILSASTPTLTIGAEHIGKTIRTNSDSTDYVINMAVNTSIPPGTEIAICRIWAKSLKIVCASDVGLVLEGESGYLYGKTISIPNNFQMIALKKIMNESGRDYWFITGNVEVVE